MAVMFIRSEMLCFILNKYGKSPIESVKTVLQNFYTPIEISDAKELLNKAVNDLNLDVDWIPRNVNRRRCDDKPRIEIDDIYAVINAFDEHMQLKSLPEFVAVNLERLPPFRTDELDLCTAVRRISALEEKVATVVSQCMDMVSASVAASRTVLVDPSRPMMSVVDMPTSAPAAMDNRTTATDVSTVAVDDGNSSSWADLASNINSSDFVQVSRHRSQAATKPRAPRLQGKKISASGESGVRGIPRRLMAFVGRLHRDTTADELTECLKSAGIIDVRCRKLSSKDGRTFNISAFYVYCSTQYSELFYDENIWPSGCELRDWVWYSK